MWRCGRSKSVSERVKMTWTSASRLRDAGKNSSVCIITNASCLKCPTTCTGPKLTQTSKGKDGLTTVAWNNQPIHHQQTDSRRGKLTRIIINAFTNWLRWGLSVKPLITALIQRLLFLISHQPPPYTSTLMFGHQTYLSWTISAVPLLNNNWLQGNMFWWHNRVVVPDFLFFFQKRIICHH